MSSKARNKFKERIGEVKILQKYIDSRPTRTQLERKRESTIHRASLVMLCGHFEGYVEDRLLEFIDEIKISQIKCIKIPPQLKVWLCKPGLAMLETEDHNSLIERIPKFIERYTAMWEHDEVLAPEDFPNIDYEDWKIGNPGSKVLEKNFRRIGIDSIWQGIDSKNSTLKGDLDALVTRRNYIAHGHFESSATSIDVKRYVKSISELVGRLDDITFRHLRNVTSANPIVLKSLNPDVLESLIESYYSRIDQLNVQDNLPQRANEL